MLQLRLRWTPFLNNLPIMLDDTSRVSSKIKDNLKGFIYDLCSGKGKSEVISHLESIENHWNNVILTTENVPLSSDNYKVEQLTVFLI